MIIIIINIIITIVIDNIIKEKKYQAKKVTLQAKIAINWDEKITSYKQYQMLNPTSAYGSGKLNSLRYCSLTSNKLRTLKLP